MWFVEDGSNYSRARVRKMHRICLGNYSSYAVQAGDLCHVPHATSPWNATDCVTKILFPSETRATHDFEERKTMSGRTSDGL